MCPYLCDFYINLESKYLYDTIYLEIIYIYKLACFYIRKWSVVFEQCLSVISFI